MKITIFAVCCLFAISMAIEGPWNFHGHFKADDRKKREAPACYDDDDALVNAGGPPECSILAQDYPDGTDRCAEDDILGMHCRLACGHCTEEEPAPAPKTFGMCNSPVRNKWIVRKICGQAIEDGEIQDAMMQDGKKARMHKNLQRYSHPLQGDVCFHKRWPDIQTWRCPKGCTMVEGKAPPFCQNEDGDACRIPFPGGGPGEETGDDSCNDDEAGLSSEGQGAPPSCTALASAYSDGTGQCEPDHRFGQHCRLSCGHCSTDEESETCSDNIQNQGETDVDCGGPCDACEPCNPDPCNKDGATGETCVTINGGTCICGDPSTTGAPCNPPAVCTSGLSGYHCV